MRFSLRLKLILVSLLLLAVPLIGFRFAALLKSSLLKSREEMLMLTARAVSTTLSNQPDLFRHELFQSFDQSGRDLYAFDMQGPIQLDGMIDDWQPVLEQARTFSGENILTFPGKNSEQPLSFRHVLAKREKYLYALFIVQDDTVVYRDPKSLRLDRNDHLQIGIADQDDHFKRYLVATSRSGWVNGYLAKKDGIHQFPAKLESKIQGVWRKTPQGYILELRMPLSFQSRKIAFAIVDVDNKQSREVAALIGTAGTERSEELGWLLARSDTIENILRSLDRPQARIWVVDSGRRIRGRHGSLQSQALPPDTSGSWNQFTTLLHRVLQPLYSFFMEPYIADFTDSSVQTDRLNLKGIEDGLQGNSSLVKYRLGNDQVEMLVAITPLINNGVVIGAVVVEQSINSILALKNRIIEESIDVTVLSFLTGGFFLLLFASRLSSRIRKLRNQAAKALGSDGHIHETIEPLKDRDEIGDLSRTLSEMLIQLRQQSEYREKMADNLEHEMRTPLASVSASLKNLSEENDLPLSCKEYVKWAVADVKRLEGLLTAIRDAATLQEALVQDDPEEFDLNEALKLWQRSSWQKIHPQDSLQLKLPQEPVMIYADPGRVKQMLEKLIENGMDFRIPCTMVEIALLCQQQSALITVANQGEPLDPKIQAQIFNSMLTLRKRQTGKPHLGLGLFIVRTIVEHYQGSVNVSSLSPDGQGTVFTVRFPMRSLKEA